MKRIFSVFATILFVSCVTIPEVQRNASFVDFTKYPDFYMSQAPTVDFKFMPLGTITAFVRCGREQGKKTRNKYSTGSYLDGTIKIVRMQPEDAIDELYRKSKEIGANGVLNIKLEFLPSNSEMGINNGWIISGMAIKR